MRAGVFLGGCVAFVVGVFTYNGCGGRVNQAQCADAGLRYCVVTDYCCPTNTTCGTGANDCPIGECCPGSGPPDGSDESPADPYPYWGDEVTVGGGDLPGNGGGGGGKPPPPMTRQ